MVRFDRTAKAQQEDTVRRETKNPELGEVKKVIEHLGEDDDSNFLVDVGLEGDTKGEQRCPVEFGGSGAIECPSVGDKVVVGHREGTKKPYVAGVAYTNENRPPVGVAGMYRDEYESAESAAGPGNLYISANTKYAGGKNGAEEDTKNLDPDATSISIEKRPNAVADPVEETGTPAKIQFFDSTYEYGRDLDSYIKVSINYKDDGGSSVKTDASWGMKFNITQGTFQLVDPEGFGIKAKGDGEFVWEHKDITLDELSGDTGNLSVK